MDPDLVLLPGDIVDEDLAPVIRQNLANRSGASIRFGVYAVTGNHEHIGGVEMPAAIWSTTTSRCCAIRR